MPSPRLRAHARKHTFPLTVDQEVADFLERGVIHTDAYAFKLPKHLLPHRWSFGVAEEDEVRRRIEHARDTETQFWLMWPDGPDSAR